MAGGGPVSEESRTKQREVLKLDRPFFDKSLVRSYSSFERLHHPPGTIPCWPGLCLIGIACSGLFASKLDLLDGAVSQFSLGQSYRRLDPPLLMTSKSILHEGLSIRRRYDLDLGLDCCLSQRATRFFRIARTIRWA